MNYANGISTNVVPKHQVTMGGVPKNDAESETEGPTETGILNPNTKMQGAIYQELDHVTDRTRESTYQRY